MATSVALLVASIGLSLLAGYLLQPKEQNLTKDSKPTTLATRGSYVPRLIGRRQIGAVFGWAGDRAKRKEDAPGGKGAAGGLLGGGQKVDVWRENGWHLLCVGPAAVLWEIEQSGKILFEGPITPSSHPSGSTIDLGNEGSFRIFWGERDQPVNTFLGDVSRVGISSRWPSTCYIEWRNKRLGGSPNWPNITYTLEVGLQETHLTESTGYVAPTRSLAGTIFSIDEIVYNAADDDWTIHLEGNVPLGSVQRIVRLAGNSLSDRDLTVKNVGRTLGVENEAGDVTFHVYSGSITVEEDLTGADATGTVQAYIDAPDDGYNLAHVLAELWFSPWPHGIGASKGLFDMASLEALGALLEEEDIPGSIIALDGQDLRQVFAGVHQDLGVFLPISPRTGLLEFVPVRHPGDVTLPNLTDDVVLDIPETEVKHGPKPADRVVFSFVDREYRYRDMTIMETDSGQVTREGYHRARSVQIVSTTNFGSSAKIATRRGQEELAGGSPVNLKAGRAARLFRPGTAFVASSLPEVMRVLEVEVDPFTGAVTLSAANDFYGVSKSSYVSKRGKTWTEPQDVAPDPAYLPVEVPEILSGSGNQFVIVARVRANVGVENSAIFISRDDTTYVSVGQDSTIMQGGRLESSISADDLFNRTEGPVVTELGPDMASVLDLSADLISWRNGRQLVVINGELFFLKKVTSLGAGRWRLDGLIRARYDTRAEAHPAGSAVFILQDDDGLAIDDVLIEPSVTLYAKSQPQGNGVVPIDLVGAQQVDLYGKGIRPVPVSNVSLDITSGAAGLSRRAYVSGDLTIRWSYSTPRTAGSGAGQFPAGQPQTGADPEGDSLVEVLPLATDTPVRSVAVEGNSYIYTEADRLSDFSAAEPTGGFRVRVTQYRGGQAADPVTETIARIQ